MDKSIANDIATLSHEIISICENSSHDDVYDQRGYDTAISTQAFQPYVHSLEAPDTPYTASVLVQELP